MSEFSETDNFLGDGDDDEAAVAQSRWEKGVEFGLARELQAWHVVSQVTMTAKAAAASAKGIPLETVMEAVERRSREPRYLPLDGNAERTLGDALASSAIDKLLLVECKALLDGSGWTREALAEAREPSDTEEGLVTIKNPGGKNRLAALLGVEEETFPVAGKDVTVGALGRKCHVLVGSGRGANGATPAPNGLLFANYWNFIFRPSKEVAATPASLPLTKLQDRGLPLEKFRLYIFALLRADMKTSSGDATWIGREMILLAHSGGWIGGRIMASELAKVLQLDKLQTGLVKKLEAREADELEAKKRKTANERKAKSATVANGAAKKTQMKK